ncbi:MAG: alpha/beta fold hydrolase [Kiritimatiellia bacterium]
MADGDYERGRAREIAGHAARLRRLAAARPPRVMVFNGWASAPAAWSLCRFPRDVLFSYVDQLARRPEAMLAAWAGKAVLVGWSMGGSSALRLAVRFPAKVAGLVLVAATPRMMEDRASGWRGMSPRRLEALRHGLLMTQGAGFFGVPEGKPNPYLVDARENLEAGLRYLLETDIRDSLRRTFGVPAAARFPVHIFQSERDGIVRPDNAAWLKTVFPQAVLTMVPGSEHALPITIPAAIDAAVAASLPPAPLSDFHPSPSTD